MTIRNKISLLFTCIVTIIILILSVTIYYFSEITVKDVFKKRLRSRASNNAQVYAYSTGNRFEILNRIDASTVSVLPEKTVVIADTEGRILYYYAAGGADSIPALQEKVRAAIKSGEVFSQIGEREYLGLRFTASGVDFVIFVAAKNVDGIEHLRQLKNVLMLCLLIGILVTLLTGYVFSAQLIRPVTTIIQDVRTISSNNLSKRLTISQGKDELSQLAGTFNELLDRLQESFNTQRRFISDASHELSTPLTSISSQLQVTLQKDRTEEEYQRVLISIQEDVEQMRQLTKSLLEIARAGTQGGIELQELRIDELLMKVISDVSRSNEEYRIRMKLDHLPENERDLRVFGNFDLLYSAIKNIIENGCKYSPDHSAETELKFEDDNAVIVVTNKGKRITDDELAQIFQPFFRGENTSETGGFGLGLALAKKIISLHKGRIEVNSDNEGTSFRIMLRLAEKYYD